MKTLHISVTLLLAFVVFVNGSSNYRSPIKTEDVVDVCMKKLDFTKEKLRELEERGASSEEDNDFYCFVACIHKELGLMNAEGNYDREALLEDFPASVSQEQRTKMVDTCLEQKGTDECGTARVFHACLKKLNHIPSSKKMKKMYDDCKDELSMTDEEVMKVMDLQDELETNCFVACLMKRNGFLNKDGTFNKDVYIEKTPFKETAKRLADVCAEEVGADDCETAARIFKCIQKNDVIPEEFPIPRGFRILDIARS